MKNQEKKTLKQTHDFLKQLINKEVEAHYHPTPLRSLDQIKHDLYVQNKQALDEYIRRIKQGIKLLQDNHLLDVDQTIVNRLLTHLEIKTSSSDPLLLQKELGLSNETLLSFYQYGKDLFQKQQQDLASHIFLLLTTLNPLAAPFWISLGIAEEKGHHIQSALLAYSMALELNKEDFELVFAVARCLKALHKPQQARAILKEALKEAVVKDNRQEFSEKAFKMLREL